MGFRLAHFLDALLAGNRLSRPLACTSIRASPLATRRQITAMTEAAVAGNIFEPLNILLPLTPQLTFDDVFAVEDIGDASHFLVGQVLRLTRRRDLRFV